MTKLIQQSTTGDVLDFYLTSSVDHISGLTGKAGTVTVKIAKNGAAGVSPSGAIAEVDATNNPGYYTVAGNATDTNTLGGIWLTASVTGADPFDGLVAQIVSFNPRNANLGITGIKVDLDTIKTNPVVNAGTVTFPTTATLASTTGAVGSVTGAVGSVTARVTANTDQINGDATAAANLAKSTRAILRGTCTVGGSTVSIPTSAFVPNGANVSGQFIGRTILFDADTTTVGLQGQASNITANTSGSTPTFTVTAMTTAPVSGDTFSIV